jgi:DNA repair photolyase
MPAIYTPKGAALEYAPLATNLYAGCVHGCKYCYAPTIVRRTRVDFHAEAKPRQDILAKIQREAVRRVQEHKVDRVHLCFTCDPYPPGDVSQLTRDVLTVLQAACFPVVILTKAGLRATRDFDSLAEMDALFGVTLAWADDARRAEWEPNAAPVDERIESLARAKAAGIPTWVSMEPVIDPVQALAVLDRLLPVADTIKVGRWNHSEAANEIDWKTFAREVKARLVAANKPHMLKKGLAELETV